jgi:hypothetical protein
VLEGAPRLSLERTGVLTAATVVLSNLVSNGPAVLLLKPVVRASGTPRAWLLIAIAWSRITLVRTPIVLSSCYCSVRRSAAD